MVGTLDVELAARTPKHPVRIVELVGPAGAGKTTLRRTLAARDNKIVPCDPPYYGRIREIPFFASNTVRMLPAMLQLRRGSDGRHLSLRQMDWLVILNGWQSVLRRQAAKTDAVIALDQGPIYLLAGLDGVRHGDAGRANHGDWWDGLSRQWATTLDLVVWLDAPDPTLVQRIRAREKWHQVRDRTEQEVSEFLGQYRAAYSRVLQGLMARPHGPGLLCLDTAEHSPEQLADCILETVRRENGKRG